MDETLQRLSLHEKENVELVLDGDVEVEDEINYDLFLVGEDCEEIKFVFVDFRVQVYDLPPRFASKGLAKSLGNIVAVFLDYDV
ncbi:hypothetical protein Goari_016469 [Gossypium aridum]|uniref:Uncharacterized protein n=1 Tax=Gossypium aridum TaxID=34290 RepID=A0A7J8WJ58_GOSAI|nr:hypothetical protein [Gossypium aridum]